MKENDSKSALFEQVLERLVEKDHGMWFDYVDSRTGRDGQPRAVLRGDPQFSEGFWKLYNYPKPGPSQRRPSIAQLVMKENHRKVVKAIRDAMGDDRPPVSHTIHARTRDGRGKMVEAYLRRVRLPDGQEVLASLHTDLTAMSEEHWIGRIVLDQLPGFVFVKRWKEERQQFVFTYVNRRLVEALGLSSPDEVINFSDADFFDDAIQVEGFLKADKDVLAMPAGSHPLVREERFSPVDQRTGTAGPTRRLMTIKMPYFSPTSKTDPARATHVLGIAVDVTPVTDLLRAVADRSELGIYIKDEHCRYQLVNDTFVRLMGALSEADLLEKTFDEILAALPSKQPRDEIDDLIRDVASEDAEVLKGGTQMHARTATFFDRAEWLTEKHCVKAGVENRPHILGLAKPLFGSSGPAAMLDKMPQCISVKRYYPDADSESQFVLVWGNQRYLERHGFHDVTQIRGKTDFDISGHRPEQAQRYWEMDGQVVKTGLRLASSEDWVKLTPSERWQKIVEDLQGQRRWEYRETQLSSEGKETVLQTTKWPEYIHGSWFVIVVYSDVTKGDREQELYHDMTVHTIKGAISPLDVAMDHLENHLAYLGGGISDLNSAKACLADASDNVNWFLEHHLQLLKMNLNRRRVTAEEVSQTLRWEIAKLDRCSHSRPKTECEINILDSLIEQIRVEADPDFIRAVVSELLRNAHKATDVRKNILDNIENGYMTEQRAIQELGWRILDNRWTPSVVARLGIQGGHLQIIIEDNGSACANSKARTLLRQRFHQAKQNPHSREDLRLGLSFCLLTLEKHQGSIELSCDDDVTKFTILFPIHTQ